MNKLFTTLSIFVAIALFTTAYGAQIAQAAEPAPVAVGYHAILGKSVSDQAVADFIASNCTQSGSFQYCQPAGLALWTDTNRIVRLVYLYINNAEGLATYKGELPLGLTPNDTMADVEYKLGGLIDVHASQAGWEPGLPDESRTPDYAHSWAVYKRFGVTIVYNSPSATNKSAAIYTIVVSK